MSKEHIRNLDGLPQEELKKKPEEMSKEELKQYIAELKQQYDEAKVSGDHLWQLELCYALLPYEDRQSLALDEIKRLKRILNDSGHKALMLKS